MPLHHHLLTKYDIAMQTSASAPDTVVIGGGIVGICTALQLQRTGHKVTVVERGVTGDEASGHNGGVFSVDCLPTGMPSVIRALPRMLRDPTSPLVIRWRYLPRLAPWLARFAMNSRPSQVERITDALNTLMSRANDAYRPLIAGTDAASTHDNHGFLFGYREQRTLDAARFSLELRSRRGVGYDILDADAIAKLSPVLAGRIAHAVYLSGAHFTTDPRSFTQTLADRFVADGGTVVRAEASGFGSTNGRVDAALTSVGPISAGSFVIAAGPWSRQLLRRLGTDVPLDVERGYGIDVPDPGVKLDCPVVLADHHVALSPFRSGLRITGLDELAGIAAAPDFSLIDRIVKGATTVFPELNLDNGARWMRRRPSMPDSLPVIGRAPTKDNVYLAFGHGHKGLGMGAITGKLVQELVDGVETAVDVTPFSPTRFSRRRPRRRAVARKAHT